MNYYFNVALYASALALEIRNDEEGETWIRTKFKTGTGDFETVHMYGHNGDIALNELIYRFDVTIHDMIYYMHIILSLSRNFIAYCHQEHPALVPRLWSTQ